VSSGTSLSPCVWVHSPAWQKTRLGAYSLLLNVRPGWFATQNTSTSSARICIGKLIFFREKLLPGSGICWETPITHIIQRTLSATAYGDSSLEGAGGYSIGLKFWWHIEFPEEVKLRTLLHRKDNKNGKLISINFLKFVTVIVNYIASLHVITTTSTINDPYPVLFNITDNA